MSHTKLNSAKNVLISRLYFRLWIRAAYEIKRSPDFYVIKVRKMW